MKEEDKSKFLEEDPWGKREIGALWLNDKGGKKYYSGKLDVDKILKFSKSGELKIVCFPNKRKGGKSPDVIVYGPGDK